MTLGVCLAAQLAGSAWAQSPALASPYQQETSAQRDARMQWFREARFGMFIHWGLYSAAAGEWDGKPTTGAGEWIMNDRQIPLSQYAKLVPEFNPVKFDARAWVRLAKAAGMRYLVITTKHHDGFGLYPSRLTDWCIKSTPFKRDPLKELAAACQEEGVRLCFYHSIMDWHHPDYAPRKPWNDIDKEPPVFDRYTDYLKGQLKELLTGYGPIGTLWFDGQWEKTWNYDRGVDLYQYVRSLQPAIIVNNRVGQDRAGVAATQEGQQWVGDFGTPEQFIPPTGYGPGVDWESCMTMNDTWGFKKSDTHWKATQTLVRNLIDCASKGGNYLLNVGPTAEGLIPEASVERLTQVGKWMQVNSEAVYGTTASPFAKQLPWGRCTKKQTPAGTTLYLHVFDWPADGELLVPGLKSAAQDARLLADARKQALKTELVEDGLRVQVPKHRPDAISSTVVLQIKGLPQIEPVLLRQKPNGVIMLPAADAILHGKTFKYEVDEKLDDIGWWTNPEDWAEWQFKVNTPGKFEVSAEIATMASGSFDCCLGDQTLRYTTPVTGNYITFKSVNLGVLELASAGRVTLAVRPVKGDWQPVNLKSLRLRPTP